MPPVAPMLAKPSKGLPTGAFLYEPKWDGFRCIVFRDGDEVILGSRNEKPLTRYFPDVVDAMRANLPERCVIDGEIIIDTGGVLDFDALQNRLHPAESRVRMLAATTPASFVAFDILALGDDDLRTLPFVERRSLLETALAAVSGTIHLTPCTADPAVAADWFTRFEGAGLDGLIAKPQALAYVEDKRLMVKVKHERTADCAVAGFRWHKAGGIVGSLLLGLWDGTGPDANLRHLGVTASFTMARRAELVGELAPYLIEGGLAGSDHPWASWASVDEVGPGGGSRWSVGKDLSFQPLRPELVCEVAYDHLQGDRFRHAATFRRWRPDRTGASCTFEQLEGPEPLSLAAVFSG